VSPFGASNLLQKSPLNNPLVALLPLELVKPLSFGKQPSLFGSPKRRWINTLGTALTRMQFVHP
jgi:hypothetical protein